MNQTTVRWASALALVSLSAAPATAQPLSDAATPVALPYRSIFDGYQKFNDQPVASWAQTNATVANIGGWRVYAKEARQPDAPDRADKAPMSKPKSGPHDAHGGKP